MTVLSSTSFTEINIKFQLAPLTFIPLSISISGYGILLKKRGGHLAHNKHSINIFEWKTEEMFCECYPHLSISKYQENSTNIQKHFRS